MHIKQKTGKITDIKIFHMLVRMNGHKSSIFIYTSHLPRLKVGEVVELHQADMWQSFCIDNDGVALLSSGCPFDKTGEKVSIGTWIDALCKQ